MTVAKLNEIGLFKGHTDAVTSLCACEENDKKLVFSSSRDRRVYCWFLAPQEVFGKPMKEFPRHGHGVNDVVVAKADGFIVTVGSDKLGRIINSKTGSVIILRGHTSDVTCAAINFREKKIVTGSVDRTINLWNTEGLLIRTFGPNIEGSHADWVTCLEFKPFDENEIVSGSADGTVKIWDIETKVVKSTFFDGKLIQECAEGESAAKLVCDGTFSVKALTLSADGDCCAYGGSNCKVYVLNLTESELITTFETESPISSLAFGLTEIILACGTKNKIYIWDVMSNDLLTVVDLSEYGNNVKCGSLLWSANNLVVGMSNGRILVFEFVR